MSRKSETFGRRGARALVAAVWSWVVMCGVLAVAFTAVETPAPIQRPSVFEVFASLLVFDFGVSAATALPVMEFLGPRIGTSAFLLAATVVVAVVVAALVRQATASSDLVASALGGVGGTVAPMAVLVFFIGLGTRTDQLPAYWMPEGSWVNVLFPALALGVPFGLAAGGRALRGEVDTGAVRGTLSELWLRTNWLFAAVVTVEVLYNVPGVYRSAFQGMVNMDPALMAGGLLVGALPFILAAAATELLPSTGDEPAEPADEESEDRRHTFDVLADAAVSSRRVQVGAAVFGLALVVGLTTEAQLDVMNPGLTPAMVLDAMGAAALVALAAALVAGLAGSGFAAVGRAVPRDLHVVGAPVTTVPMLVLVFVFAVVGDTSAALLWAVVLAATGVGGPLVGAAIRRRGLGSGATVAAAVGTTAALLVAELSVLGLGGREFGTIYSMLAYETTSMFAGALVLGAAVAVPCLALLAVGDGIAAAAD